MLKTILLSLLITAALLLPAVLLPVWLLLPPCPKGMCSLLQVSGSGETLEQQCRAFLLLRRLGLFRQSLFIVDVGLNPEGRRLATRMTELSPCIILCDPEHIQSILLN